MMNSSHTIARQTIDLKLNSKTAAMEIQSKVKDVYFEKILPIINAELDQMGGAGQTILIDHLELDLGQLSFESLQDEMVEKFKSVLSEKIDKLQLTKSPPSYGEFSSPPEENTIIKDESDSNFDLLVHFLQSGNLPWWGKLNDQEHLIKIFLNQIENTGAPLVEFIRMNIAKSEFSKRLVFQFPDAILATLTKVLFQKIDLAILGEVTEVKYLFEVLNPFLPNQVHPRQLTWQSVWDIGLTSNSNQVPLAGQVLQKVSNESGIPIIKLFLLASEASMARKNNGPTSKEAMRTIYKIFLTSGVFASPLQSSYKNAWTELVAAAQVVSVLPFTLKFEDGQKGIAQLKKHARASAGDERLIIDKLIETLKQLTSAPDPDEVMNTSNDKSKSTKSDIDKPGTTKTTAGSTKNEYSINSEDELHLSSAERDQVSQDWLSFNDSLGLADKIFIENAGLILLSSYLPTLFRNIGIVNKSEWVNMEGVFRAVQLLQYLSHGKTGDIEHELSLNKLLCGLNISEPIDFFIELSHSERDESDNLLRSAIMHWPALKNTSIEGLRNMFLHRNGILTRQDFGWRLRVERSSYDILLDRIPWSFSTVRLPWMKSIISTEW